MLRKGRVLGMAQGRAAVTIPEARRRLPDAGSLCISRGDAPRAMKWQVGVPSDESVPGKLRRTGGVKGLVVMGKGYVG